MTILDASPAARLAPTDPASAERLSVVVAAQNARSTIVSCLAALEAQRPDGVAQIILADNSTDGTAALARQRFPDVEVIEQSWSLLVPQLWAEGILRSGEEIVALTTAEMLPSAGWARALLQSYGGHSWAGVGGPILPNRGLGLRDQAVYWLRYSRFAVPHGDGEVRDIAGDNGSYRRRLLLPLVEQIRREGFWENEVHDQLRTTGARFFLASDAMVRYAGHTSFVRFARQRTVHGRRFGAKRGRSLGRAWRVARVALWPLTPFAFLGRIVRDALAARADVSFVQALPALLYLLTCWSLGELVGFVDSVIGSAHPNGERA